MHRLSTEIAVSMPFHPPTANLCTSYTDSVDFQRTPRRVRLPVRYPNAIRQYRVKIGISQRALAHSVGRSLSMVCLWERGRRLPSLGNAFRLARALETLLEALYPTLYEAARGPHEGGSAG